VQVIDHVKTFGCKFLYFEFILSIFFLVHTTYIYFLEKRASVVILKYILLYIVTVLLWLSTHPIKVSRFKLCMIHNMYNL